MPLNVNIVKQDLLNKKQFLKILWSVVWKGGFQLMQILGLLGMYFDAVVVEVKTFFTFIQIGSGHTVWHAEVKKVKRGQGISATNAIGNIACATAPVGWF